MGCLIEGKYKENTRVSKITEDWDNTDVCLKNMTILEKGIQFGKKAQRCHCKKCKGRRI